MNDKKIAIFDSGLGGLTVLKALKNILPNENYLYFGDVAHLPYGNKSKDAVIKYSEKIIQFLIQDQIKIIIFACNTASSFALDYIKQKFTIPMIGAINPSILYALRKTKNQNIAVIGTEATISSNIYQTLIKNNNQDAKILALSCPLFVPIIEEGWHNTTTAMNVAEIYLKRINQSDTDTLILGCTHYPLLQATLQSVINKNIELIDCSLAIAEATKRYISSNNLLNTQKEVNEIEFFVTDLPQKFNFMGSQFLGEKITNIQKVEI